MKDYSVISTREFTIRKLKSFGIPYAIFLLIAVVFSIAYETYRGKLSFYILFDIVYSALLLKGISTLWFIPVLFIGEILYVYNKKNNGVRQFVIFICSVFVLLILHFSVGQCRLLDDSYMFVFLYPCMVLEKSVIAFLLILLSDKITKYFLILPLPILIGGVGSLILSWLNTGVDFNNLNFGEHPSLFFIGGLLGSYGVIGTLKWVSGKGKELRCLNFLGRNSMFIMCTHMPLYVAPLVTYIFKRIVPVDIMGVVYYMRLLSCMLFVIAIEFFLIRIWQWIKRKTKNMKIYKLIFQYI